MNNDRERELIRSLIQNATFAVYGMEMQKLYTRNFTTDMPGESKMSRDYLEHHPSIKTDVTDKDMLLLQIDLALDAKDMKLFVRLTDELKGMGVLV